MDGGYPLQMDFSLSSSSKRFWICWVGMVTGFCILGPALAVVGLRGEFKRGIIWNGEGEMQAICAGNRHSAVSVVIVHTTSKNTHTQETQSVSGFFSRRLAASALLRSPLILPTWTLVHHNLNANRLTQYAKIIQPTQDWQWSHKSPNSQGKIPPQNPD